MIVGIISKKIVGFRENYVNSFFPKFLKAFLKCIFLVSMLGSILIASIYLEVYCTKLK